MGYSKSRRMSLQEQKFGVYWANSRICVTQKYRQPAGGEGLKVERAWEGNGLSAKGKSCGVMSVLS